MVGVLLGGIVPGGMPLPVAGSAGPGITAAGIADPSHETLSTTGVSPYPAVAPLLSNDASVTENSDLSPHIPIGIPVQLAITITITNGMTPQNMPVSVSLLGPPICDPRLVPIAADADSTPDILSGPTILMQQQSTRLDWVELGMQADEVRVTQRMYQVNCPAGDWTVNLVADIYPQGDPNPSNNENPDQPIVHADIPDSDQDTILNPQDNCPYVANPNQLNTDADNEGNACDNDDDNDGVDDGPEAAPECTNDTDDDADTVVNDGCQQAGGFPESGVNSCNDGTDDADEDPDPPVVQDDLAVNDGCPVAGEDDLCDLTSEDFDGTDDADGCPEIDSAIESVVKEHTVSAEVDVTVQKDVTVTISNHGSGAPADLEMTLSLRSDLASGCQARWLPDAGHPDVYFEDIVGSFLFSLVEHTEPAVSTGEDRTST